jgi:hypothetical protein
MMPLGRKILALSALCGLAWSQTGLTTIQDTLFKADGTRFSGSLGIQWVTFDLSNGGTVVQQSRTVPVVNGNLQLQLVPNAAIASPGNIYTVIYQGDGRQQFTEMWTVPASATALTVRDVRTGTVIIGGGNSGGGGSNTGVPAPIPESSVTGLTADLSLRPTKGVAFGANGVAVVDSNGAIETAVGQVGDCVLVDGTTGPCGAPTFSDAETPGGIVDGSNNNFTLANVPSGTSLMLFRNGLYQTLGFDYTLAGLSIQFTSGAVPEPGDALVASYRVDPSAAGSIGGISNPLPSIRASVAPQVLCNSAGISTRVGLWTTLGSCDVPPSQLRTGDRIELRFTFQHVGRATGFDIEIDWGATTILARHGGVQDAAVAGGADAAIIGTGALLTVQSFGSVLQFLPSVLASPLQNGVQVALKASAGASLTDTVQLANFTVVRYPAN